MRQKNPDYNAMSNEVAKEVEAIEHAHRAKAQAMVDELLCESVQTLGNIMRMSEEEVRRESAAKHLLKLGGLEIEEIKHSGNVKFEPFVISRGDHEK